MECGRWLTFTHKATRLKKVLKITGVLLLILFALAVSVVLLVRTERVQNWLVGMATEKLSVMLGTEVAIKHVSLSLFNRLHLEGALLRDQKKDTILYAGNLKLAITDWFFLKDEAELTYLGLDDAYVNLNRSDSVWNYQFVADAFSGPKKPKDTTRPHFKLRLQRIELNRIRFIERDGWYGRDMNVSLGHLDIDADEIDFERRKVFVDRIEVEDPYFAIRDYDGKRPPRPRVRKVRPPRDTTLQWNTEDWDILVGRITLKDGTFRNDIDTKRAPYPYLDGQHLAFRSIQADLRDISWHKDTISGKVSLSAKERSGFTLNTLKADMTLDPRAMVFKSLEIGTPRSRLGDYFAMRYEDFNQDMADFLDRVVMEGRFRNSTLDSRDLAFFAPELKGLDKSIRMNGDVRGTVTDLTAKGFRLEYGKQTRLVGDIRMKGLPDIDKTLIQFESKEFRTTYQEASQFAPEIRNITEPRLSELGNVAFTGSFNGYLNDFQVKGTLQTSLGTVRSDIKMKLPAGQPPSYDGRLETAGFNLGRFLGNDELGNMAFAGNISGRGFDPKNASSSIDGDVGTFRFNGYDYRNISLKGTLKDMSFIGDGRVNDPNLTAVFSGSIETGKGKSAIPRYRLDLDIAQSDLQALGFSKDPMRLSGKGAVDLAGRNIEEMVGEASVTDIVVGTGRKDYAFGRLDLLSRQDSTGRTLELGNDDFKVSLTGRYNIRALPNTVNSYLSKYYPLYFKAPATAPVDQVLRLRADIRNVDSYLGLFAPELRGLENSVLEAGIDSREKSFRLNVRIPSVAYRKAEVEDFNLDAVGNLDSLKLQADARDITLNDSLEIPGAVLVLQSSGDMSDIRLATSSNQSVNSAELFVTVQNLKDGVRIQFNPSSIVMNSKTWRIERNGLLTISRSMIDARDIRIVNGDQQLEVSTLPSKLNSSNDLLVTLRRVNLGDILPYVLKEPKIEGLTSGDITIEDPYNSLNVYLNAQTEQTRFEGDSIGIISLNGNWNNSQRRATYFLNSSNEGYMFDVRGQVSLSDSTARSIDTYIDIGSTRADLLEKYVGIVFSDMKGTAAGKLRLHGPLSEPLLTGSVRLKDAEVEVGYTKCRYRLGDPEIVFRPGVIDFGTMKIRDEAGNDGQVSGRLTHRFFNDMGFNFSASSKRLQLVNTTKTDNSLFYGTAVGRVNFLFNGQEDDLRLYVEGEPVDSSKISIVTSSSSKETGEVDFIVWREYGREMNLDSTTRGSSNLSIDLELTANPFLKVDVVLDELSGDIISGVGNGNLKIHTGTNESTTLNGRFTIERGNYNFNFQDIFKKPFTLEPGSGSYISWTGDPYNAEIGINATYLAEKVRMSTLFNDPNSSTVSGVSSDILREISDVNVNCLLTGTLSQPNPSFQITLPSNSTVRNNPTVDSKLKTINRDPLEVSKQATYLIVFKSFAPQAAIVASNLNSELFSNTISGVINSILANSVQNFFYKLFGSTVDVNFNYSRVLTDMSGTGNASNSGAGSPNYRENVSLQFIKSLLNDKLIITFGSDFNFSTNSRMVGGSQSFLFLPDVNVEYKITPDGKFRTSFFFRSNFDALSSTGRRDRTGGNVSFRTEFDKLFR